MFLEGKLNVYLGISYINGHFNLCCTQKNLYPYPCTYTGNIQQIDFLRLIYTFSNLYMAGTD